MLLPMYTPTLTDEANVSHDKVFFGGISIYLQQHHALFRKSPRILDRIWDSPAMLKLASRRSIPTNPKLLGEMTVSMLKGEDGYQRKELEKLIDWLTREAAPDLINLPYTLLISLAKPLKDAGDGLAPGNDGGVGLRSHRLLGLEGARRAQPDRFFDVQIVSRKHHKEIYRKSRRAKEQRRNQ